MTDFNKSKDTTVLADDLINELVMLHDDLVDDLDEQAKFEYYQKSLNKTILFLESYRDAVKSKRHIDF